MTLGEFRELTAYMDADNELIFEDKLEVSSGETFIFLEEYIEEIEENNLLKKLVLKKA